MAQPRRPAEGGDPARPLADLERCFRICFLMIPAMVPAGLERSSQPPPPLTAVSSRSRLTGTEGRRPSAHSRERLEALAEATAAAAAAESPEHDAQAAAAAASAILAAASPKRPGAGRRAWGRSELEVGGACGSSGGGRGRGVQPRVLRTLPASSAALLQQHPQTPILLALSSFLHLPLTVPLTPSLTFSFTSLFPPNSTFPLLTLPFGPSGLITSVSFAKIFPLANSCNLMFIIGCI